MIQECSWGPERNCASEPIEVWLSSRSTNHSSHSAQSSVGLVEAGRCFGTAEHLHGRGRGAGAHRQQRHLAFAPLVRGVDRGQIGDEQGHEAEPECGFDEGEQTSGVCLRGRTIPRLVTDEPLISSARPIEMSSTAQKALAKDTQVTSTQITGSESSASGAYSRITLCPSAGPRRRAMAANGIAPAKNTARASAVGLARGTTKVRTADMSVRPSTASATAATTMRTAITSRKPPTRLSRGRSSWPASWRRSPSSLSGSVRCRELGELRLEKHQTQHVLVGLSVGVGREVPLVHELAHARDRLVVVAAVAQDRRRVIRSRRRRDACAT